MNYQYDDGGRSTSRRPRQKLDCVVRAIAIAFASPYDEIYDLLAELGRKCGRSTPKKLWQDWLNKNKCAVRCSFPAVRGQPRMNLVSFCNHFSTDTYVVQMAGHLCAVINGIVHDVDQPRWTACVYAAWRIEKIS